jgi:formate dehydrogenase iron-sulfur subunit
VTIKIYIARETSARSVGADDIAQQLQALTRQAGLDIEIIRHGSRGMTWLEPLLEVETEQGRVAYGPVTPDDLNELVAAEFYLGKPHVLGHGLTERLAYFAVQRRVTFNRCGLVTAGSIDDYRAHDGFVGLERALQMTPQQIIDEIKQSGLRGRGGAGFPTGIKWQTVANTPAEQKYIVCNADEGDSGTFSDRLLMEGDPLALIEGMIIAGRAVGADAGVIYLRSEYPLAAELLTNAITAARKTGWLGNAIQGSDFKFDLELRIGAGSYVCGEETAMLESLEGKRGQVRCKPPLPASKGLWQKPSVINNVITLATVPAILAEGTGAYAELGVDRSRGTLPFQLAGNIKHGGLVEVPFGLTLRELIFDIGGGTASGRPVRAVQVGGPLGAYFPASLLDTPLDYEAFTALDGTVGHGGVVVFDDTVDLARQARFAMEFCVVESCGKCTPCRIGSVRGVELLDRIIADREAQAERNEQSFTLLADLCATMTNTSLCAMGTMTPNPVRSALEYFAEDFRRVGS